ncbi:hypothetical protein HYX15_00880 [Candidatus Woesearchaeota archaeon]|nr:hypothetical protein [Candidatus Woesearchaeota archaeon]
MDGEIITYEVLYDILRKEKYNQELQRLDKDFFEKVTKYINEKMSILESQEQKTSIFASTELQKTRKQLENISKILKDLYERRENKIIQIALFASKTKEKPDLSVLLPDEQGFYNSIILILNQYRMNILFNVLEGKAPRIVEVEKPKELKSQNKDKENKTIMFTENVPKFMGDDLSIYGPFKQEDIASLPKMIVEILVSKGKAREI